MLMIMNKARKKEIKKEEKKMKMKEKKTKRKRKKKMIILVKEKKNFILKTIHMCCVSPVHTQTAFQSLSYWFYSKTSCIHTEHADASLTHKCLKVPRGIVVWIYVTFHDNLNMKKSLAKYLKESCSLYANQNFSFKYFPLYLNLQDSIKIIRLLLATVGIKGLM